MKTNRQIAGLLFTLAIVFSSARSDEQVVKEKAFDGPNNVKLKVRMEGPYTGGVALEVDGVPLAWGQWHTTDRRPCHPAGSPQRPCRLIWLRES